MYRFLFAVHSRLAFPPHPTLESPDRSVPDSSLSPQIQLGERGELSDRDSNHSTIVSLFHAPQKVYSI